MREKKELTKKQQKTIAGIAFAVFLLMMGIIGRFIGVPVLRFAREPEHVTGKITKES